MAPSTKITSYGARAGQPALSGPAAIGDVVDAAFAQSLGGECGEARILFQGHDLAGSWASRAAP